MDPPPFPTVHDEPGVLQDLHREREPGLTGPEHVHEVADAPLPVAQPVEHREPRLVGQGVKDPGRLRVQSHAAQYIKIF